MVFPGSVGHSGALAVYLHRRRGGVAAVEFAAATTLRLASNYLLAGAGNTGPVPHPLRWIWTPRVSSLPFPPPHGGAPGADDSRGAGALPAGHARTLRLRPTHE